MQIEPGLVVTIEYSLRDADGQVLEASEEKAPMTFVIGTDRMLPGLAAVLLKMKVGESRQGVIPPGELIPLDSLPMRRVPLSEFPQGHTPKLGDRFQAKGPQGQPVQFEVSELQAQAVIVRVLHPLHEVAVHYDVKVLAARRASIPPPPPMADDEALLDLTDELLDLTDDLLED